MPNSACPERGQRRIPCPFGATVPAAASKAAQTAAARAGVVRTGPSTVSHRYSLWRPVRTTPARAASVWAAFEAAAGTVAPNGQGMRLCPRSGQALFGMQHDCCERAAPEDQGRSVHKLRPLRNLPLRRPTIVNLHDLLDGPGRTREISFPT